MKELTPEQRLMWEIQVLQKSAWWVYIVDELTKSKITLEEKLKKKSVEIRTQEDIVDINYIWNKIELIEDLITMPTKILEEFDPIIDSSSPNT